VSFEGVGYHIAFLLIPLIHHPHICSKTAHGGRSTVYANIWSAATRRADLPCIFKVEYAPGVPWTGFEKLARRSILSDGYLGTAA
jgi:hypothetical protein